MTCNIALTALDYPSRSCVKNWNLGVDDGYLSSLLAYWRYDYDWSRKEAELNRFYVKHSCSTLSTAMTSKEKSILKAI